jgi:hypothetical protein
MDIKYTFWAAPIDTDLLIQVVQILGSLTILAAYVGSQFRMMRPASMLYSVLNLIGSAILAVIAFWEQQWGFLLLEGVWAIVSGWAVLSLLRGRAPDAPH